MRYIDKSPKEPVELLEFRKKCNPNCEWDNFDTRGKNAVRKRLLTDQAYLCCYCMQRIDLDSMQVEHYLCQSGYPSKQLIWMNLLGSCPGGKGNSKTQRSCDTQKADKALNIDPLNNGHLEGIRYSADGRVLHDGDGFQNDLDETLNLNNEVLKYNRKNALEGLKQALQKKYEPKNNWPKSRLEKKIATLRNDPRGEPFLGLLEFWLTKCTRNKA
jgi:uncharacterized protein (TIGR02646 family)